MPPRLYFTLKPTFILDPGSAAISPAEADRIRYPPPVMKALSGFASVTTTSSAVEFPV